MADHRVMLPWGEERERIPDQRILSIMFGKEAVWAKRWEEWNKEEKSKVGLFEKGLANELHSTDTIEVAIKKIVKMALAVEFGASLVKASGAKAMVETITRGILGDAELRKQALAIIDRYISPEKENKI